MERKIVEIIKVTDELMFEMFMKNKINHHNVYDVKKLIKAINNGHPWDLMVNPIEIQILLKCCEIDKNPFHTMMNRIKQLNMKQNQFEFKPFDKVLVRDEDTHPWRINFFSHYMPKHTDRAYVCASGTFNQCIPYNKNTAHLVGTNDEYTPPQPKTYQVTFIAQNGSNGYQVSYTDDEFKKFIETAVLNNKDVSNFDVRKICG